MGLLDELKEFGTEDDAVKKAQQTILKNIRIELTKLAEREYNELRENIKKDASNFKFSVVNDKKVIKGVHLFSLSNVTSENTTINLFNKKPHLFKNHPDFRFIEPWDNGLLCDYHSNALGIHIKLFQFDSITETTLFKTKYAIKITPTYFGEALMSEFQKLCNDDGISIDFSISTYYTSIPKGIELIPYQLKNYTNYKSDYVYYSFSKEYRNELDHKIPKKHSLLFKLNALRIKYEITYD